MKNKFSLYSFFTVVIALFGSFCYYQDGQKRILNDCDALGYYYYLPAVVVHGDLMTFEKSFVAKEVQAGRPVPPKEQKAFNNEKPLPDNHVLDKYTCGVAILASPFYLIAHITAPILGFEQNGFSPIYVTLYLFAGLFYVLWGLWIVRKTLLLYFPDKAVAITLILLALATNLYYFSVYESGMSHGFLFFLYAQLIFATIGFYTSPNLKNAVLIGLCAGGITVIRPTEIISLFIPLLYGINNWSSLKSNFELWKQHFGKIIIAIFSFILAGVPHMLYWKAVTNHFLYYSYEKETFDFKHPHIIGGLFSYHNGWLAYSPIMALSLIGLFLLKKEVKWKVAILFFLPLHIYIIYSWWCWNYINGIGSRPMVETYPLLALGMASFWTWIEDKNILKTLFLGIGIFAIYLFTSLVWQFSKGLVWTECANGSFYWYMVGKTKADWRGVTMLDTKEWQPDTNDIKLNKILVKENFEDSLNQNFVRQNPNSKFCFRLDSKKEFCEIYNAKISDINIKKDQRIKAQVNFMRTYMGQDFYKNSMFTVVYFDKDGKTLKSVAVRLDNKSTRNTPSLWGWEGNIWTKFYFFMKFDEYVEKAENIKVYVWNPTNNPIYLDDFEVSLWDSK